MAFVLRLKIFETLARGLFDLSPFLGLGQKIFCFLPLYPPLDPALVLC